MAAAQKGLAVWRATQAWTRADTLHKVADAMVAAAGQEDAHSSPGVGVRDFASALSREGIRLVAERVECEEAVPALISLGVPLAQGFVFAAPRAVRAEVFEQGAALPDEETSFDPSLLRCAG